jgi:rfaE bifunctional protein nucleotidyltransferase chain/domain
LSVKQPPALRPTLTRSALNRFRKFFASSCLRGEVESFLPPRREDAKNRRLLRFHVAMTSGKIKSLDEMVKIRRQLRDQGRKLVFTNGCFDLLHVGHVRFLHQARSLGDALAVGVNSDRSTRESKGRARPIVPEMERAEILSALGCVDYVVIFDDLTPRRVIDALVPDVLVKGADWRIAEIVGRETVENAGGIVRNIPLTEGSSTSNIIERIVKAFS